MSKIWKNPILLPDGVTISQEGDLVVVKGPKGTLQQSLLPHVSFVVEGSTVSFSCDNDEMRKYWGTMRALVANMVHGVKEWYTKSLQVIGVGFDASVQWSTIAFKLWFSHPVSYPIPQGVDVKVEKDPKWNAVIHLSSYDKQLIGQTASQIRNLKKPEPYKGKGIRYLGETIKLKAGKAAKK